MTEFRINVVVDPSGAARGGRAVERQLSRVETSANRVQAALRRAFAFVTLGFAVREVVRYADTLTDLQNRLRLLVPEQAALVRTTRDLLAVANETRTAFDGTVILYQRLGLATRELGLEQNGLLGIVKSINQALILSGASAKEANNGLIQLSQGIASNRLGGDELRSTLEQLPAVADVIARELGVTRGELRELGAEGKITGEVIIEAFRNASESLEEQFGRTVPTLGQSFTVLRNNLIAFFGDLNQGTGTLSALGAIIRFVGNNIDTLVRSLGVAGAAFVALRLAPTVQAFFELQAAVRAGTSVILGSALAAKQKAIFDREQAAAAVLASQAEVAKTATTIAAVEAERALAATQTRAAAAAVARTEVQVLGAAANRSAAQAAFELATAERANIATSGTLADVRARAAILDADVAATRRGVTVATQQLTAAEARLAVAQGAAGDAALIASVDEGRLAVAHTAAARAADAQAAAEGRLATATAAANVQANFFTRSLAAVRVGISRVTAAVAANPIGALLVVLTAAGSALFLFRDRIQLAEDSLATLGDFVREFGSQAATAFNGVLEALERAFGEESFMAIRAFVDQFRFSFRDIIEFAAAFADTIIGTVAGILAFTQSIVQDLPQVFERGFKLAVNAAITALEFLPDVVVAVVKTIGQTLSIFITGLTASFAQLGVAAEQALAGNFEAAGEAAEFAAKLASNAFSSASEGIGSRFAQNIAGEINDELIPRLDVSTTDAFSTIGSRAADSFAEAFNANPVLGFVAGLFQGAEARAEDRQAAEDAMAEAEARRLVTEAATEQGEAVGKVLAQLREEQTVLQTSVALGEEQAEVQRALLDINRQLREAGLAELTTDQEIDIAALIQRNQQLQEFTQLQRDLIPIEDQFAARRQTLATAFAEGALSFQQYEEALRRVRLEEAALGTSISDGLITGLERAGQRLQDFASTVENILVNLADGVVTSFGETINQTFGFIAESLTEGSASWADYRDAVVASFSSLVDSLLSQLAELLAQQLLVSLLGGTSFGNLLGVGLDTAASGSPAALANQPFLVGEEGPEIFTPGQTGSITPTDQTIGALASASGSMGQTTVVQSAPPEVNLSVVNVTDPDEALDAIDTPGGEQKILNVLQRNPEAIRRLIG